MESLVLPIAEMFESIQGEGVYAGHLMHFIRLAGCNVGKYVSVDTEPNHGLRVLLGNHPKHSICTSALGTRFLCDTDYHAHEKLDLVAALQRSSIRRVCMTGGEPFLHDMAIICARILGAGKEPHIETSGTLPIPEEVGDAAYVVCSPKAGFLPANLHHIHEFKFVVGPSLGTVVNAWDRILAVVDWSEAPIFLQPINGVHDLDQASLDFALQMLRAAPASKEAALSVQLHKLLRMP